MQGKYVGFIGKTVRNIAVSQGEIFLRMTFTDGDVLYLEAEGDCCSESWWADLLGVRTLLGGTICLMHEIPMPIPMDGRTRQESDEQYGIAIGTEGGTCNLIFRNSSNGYYGGWCEVRNALDDQTAAETVWKDITNDWSA